MSQQDNKKQTLEDWLNDEVPSLLTRNTSTSDPGDELGDESLGDEGMGDEGLGDEGMGERDFSDIDLSDIDFSDPQALRTLLLQRGMESLFEDQKFSGELLSRMFKLGLSEEEMDAIYKRAEDEIVGFVAVLADAGAELARDGFEALTGFVFRLKSQILKNPTLYVEGS